ncbi:hypothetical protein [Streptomyces puniciscabiei]|uniref:hypothetical protein n=1 Tax=Streptomyces puniciscabiei TaxID=164348 RepID=UPI0018FEFD98|nr:hypothetical protein [Streptomyces puniciscabiei]
MDHHDDVAVLVLRRDEERSRAPRRPVVSLNSYSGTDDVPVDVWGGPAGPRASASGRPEEDEAIAFAGTQGNFELNAMRPVVINNFLHAATILADACTKMREYCIEGTELNRDQIDTLRSAALASGYISAADFDRIVRPAAMVGRT